MKLTYTNYCDYFAKKCPKCNGAKKILIHHGEDDTVGTWNACGCQFIASTKWRYDQIPLPSHLKGKTWEDFRGIVVENGKEVDLACSFTEAKEKALEYCFGSGDPSVIKDRVNSLVVQDRTNNVVISGGQRTGKTLLVALILKEVVYASVLKRINLAFKYVKNSELLDKSRWDNNKQVDHEFLADLAELDFLVLDGINDPAGHTTPPDLISLDGLFSARHLSGAPTIFVCSDTFKLKLFSENKYERDAIIKKFGEEYYSSLTNSENVFIDLQREG